MGDKTPCPAGKPGGEVEEMDRVEVDFAKCVAAGQVNADTARYFALLCCMTHDIDGRTACEYADAKQAAYTQ